MIHSDFRNSENFEIRYLPTKIFDFCEVRPCVLFFENFNFRKMDRYVSFSKIPQNFRNFCEISQFRTLVHSDSANRKLVHMRSWGPLKSELSARKMVNLRPKAVFHCRRQTDRVSEIWQTKQVYKTCFGLEICRFLGLSVMFSWRGQSDVDSEICRSWPDCRRQTDRVRKSADFLTDKSDLSLNLRSDFTRKSADFLVCLLDFLDAVSLTSTVKSDLDKSAQEICRFQDFTVDCSLTASGKSSRQSRFLGQIWLADMGYSVWV